MYCILESRARRTSFAVLRRLDRADVLDDLAAPVTDHATAARMSDQAFLERQLDAFQPLVVPRR